MVVDRGGVRYPIEVRDRYSDRLINLRSQLRLTRVEFRKLREEAAKSRRAASVAGGGGTGNQAQQARQAANIEARAAEAIRRRIRDQRRLQTEIRRRIGLQNRATQGAVRGGARVTRSFNRQTAAGNRLLSTVKRLLGAFALFQVARVGAGAFSELIKSGFAFNQTVEQSRIGIAGILVAVAEIKDEQGKVVEGAQAFVVAQGIARKQQKELLKDSLLTTATYEELLTVFQRALGPGISAGLQVDEVREISVLISQAASAVGLLQNQLDEEIRALFTGNIRTNTTRLAQIVGLTNAELRTTDDLAGLLITRFQGFRLAAEQTANTVGGLSRRIIGAVQVLAGGAAIKSFETLRATLRKVFDALLDVQRGADGVIKSVTPNKDVAAAFEIVFAAVNRLLVTATKLAAQLGFKGLQEGAAVLASAIDFLGQAALFTFEAVAGSLETIRTALEPIALIFLELRDTIDEALGTGAAESLAKSLASALVAILAIKSALGGVGFLFAFIFKQIVGTATTLVAVVASTARWAVSMTSVQSAWKGSLASAGLITIAIVAMAIATKALTEQILGVSLSWQDMLEIAESTIEQMFTKLIALGNIVGVTIVASVRESFIVIKNFLAELLDDASRDLDTFRGDKNIESKELARQKDALFRENLLARVRKNNELIIADVRRDSAQQQLDADKKAAEIIFRIRQRAFGFDAPVPRVPGKKPNIRTVPLEPTTAPEDGDRFRGTVAPKSPKAKKADKDEARLENAALQRAKLRADVDKARLAVFLPGAEKEAELRRINLELAKEQLRVAQSRGSIAEIEEQLAGLRAAGQGESGRAIQLESRILAIKQKQAEVAAKQHEINKADSGVLGGVVEAFKTAGAQIATGFQLGFAIVQSALKKFSATVSSVISDALDPDSGQNSEKIKEKFANLFGDIANIIIQKLTDQAIAAAINFIVSSFGTGGSGKIVNGVLTRHEGGLTPKPGAPHSQARGYKHGGSIGLRPRNIHPKDTVPIWAQPEEFIHPVSAVRKYGVGFMESVRTGALDPAAASGMAAASGASNSVSSTTGSAGFASGGSIPKQVAAATSDAVSVKVESEPVEAFVVGTERQARTMINTRTFRRMMRENRDTIQ